MFVILQKYDFSSKSQLRSVAPMCNFWCLWYCKSTIFQANHNCLYWLWIWISDVCDTAKVRFFKQITTVPNFIHWPAWMFVILQKYDFSSKSQPMVFRRNFLPDVCDTAKVRFFKQITTNLVFIVYSYVMFVILQKYDFSSKSQRKSRIW